MTATLLFDDQFNYATREELLQVWKLRGPQTYEESAGTDREGTRISASMLVVEPDVGALRMCVRPDKASPGNFLTAMITTGLIPQVCGYMEANLKFGRPRGAHGAFWHQSGYGPGGAEVDVVEWFGERKPGTNEIESQGVQQTVYTGPSVDGAPLSKFAARVWTDGVPASADPDDVHFDGRGRFGSDGTWWGAYHAYGCEWTQSGYSFYVDGVRTRQLTLPAGNISAPSGTRAGELILSLLSNDWERDDLEAHVAGGGAYSDLDVRVGRVRFWTARPV